jgi:hypothetical protein
VVYDCAFKAMLGQRVDGVTGNRNIWYWQRWGVCLAVFQKLRSFIHQQIIISNSHFFFESKAQNMDEATLNQSLGQTLAILISNLVKNIFEKQCGFGVETEVLFNFTLMIGSFQSTVKLCFNRYCGNVFARNRWGRRRV